MHRFPTLTDEVAQRINRIGAEIAVSQYGGLDNVGRFGGAIALKAGHKNGVYRFSGEDLTYLDEILAFFGSDAINPAFYLTSMGFTEELGIALTKAGFYQSDFKQTALYGLPAQTLSPLASGIEIERVDLDTLEIFLETVATGFEWPSEWRESAKDGLRRWSATEGFHAYLARYRGEPAGAGVLFVHDGTGFPCYGAVNPRFRGKGCQTALLHHRLYAANELGCRLIIGGADFGSTSFRNQLRAGLWLAYIESIWTKTVKY